MPSIEEKLDLFNRMIIGDATRSRDAIMNQLKGEAEKKQTESKAEIDRDAAETYEREIAKALQEGEARISRANILARKTLMSTRNEIIASVLRELSERLAQFTASNSYPAYLLKNIEDALAVIPSGKIELYLTPRDLEQYQTEIRRIAPAVTFLAGDAAMIGGCRAVNRSMGVYVDNTFEKKVELCADELFLISGLRIGFSRHGDEPQLFK